MEISIHDATKISSIQSEFNRLFPYLRLEFFKTPHPMGVPSSKKIMISAAKTVGQYSSVHHEGIINIKPSMTVSDLEQVFNSMYGLCVQLFRKSGSVWLETTVTDSWTLEKQNQQGEELSQ